MVPGCSQPHRDPAPPAPAGVTCDTPVAGCRLLTFSYAVTTTATGTTEPAWGDYVGRLREVTFTAFDLVESLTHDHVTPGGTPQAFTHALLLRDGGVVAQGLLRDTLTADNLSKTFDIPLKLSYVDGRFSARA